jgi:ankyrin repeat protein
MVFVEVIVVRCILLLIYIFVNISHTTTENQRFPLLDATKLGSKKLVLTALSRQENPDQNDEFGNTPLHYAVHMQNRTITDILLEWHANPNIQNKKGKTALHLAAQRSDDYITRRLLLYGARIAVQDLEGNTPLHFVALHADQEAATDIATHLIAHKADTSLKNNNQQTALMIALQLKQKHQSSTSNNRKKMNIDHFLKTLSFSDAQQSNIHVLNRHFIQCAKTDNIKTMQKIATYPTIEKNLRYGKYGRTALMYAAHNNRALMAEYLVKNLHMDKRIKDYYGKTAFDYAQKHNNNKLNELLVVS